jgi:hypothetical protein
LDLLSLKAQESRRIANYMGKVCCELRAVTIFRDMQARTMWDFGQFQAGLDKTSINEMGKQNNTPIISEKDSIFTIQTCCTEIFSIYIVNKLIFVTFSS